MTKSWRLALLLISGTAAAGVQLPADRELAALGLGLQEDGDSLKVIAASPRSEAEEMGFKRGDRLLYLDGRPAASRAQAAAALRQTASYARHSAVVMRGIDVESLDSARVLGDPLDGRALLDLSARERDFRQRRLKAADAAADAAIKSASWDLSLPARQSVWIALPKGLPAGLKPGDVVVAETVSAVAADPSLDFLLLAPKTQLWGKVLAGSEAPQTNSVRLFFYKLRLAGEGNFYPFAGRIVEISGADEQTRLTDGGTLVLPAGKKIAETLRMKVESLAPLTLTQAPASLKAGPGFWIAKKERGYEIAQIVPGRSAEKAGLRPGDVLSSIEGHPAETCDFATALSMIYGKQGTSVRIGVVRAGGKSETLELVRGVGYTQEGQAAVIMPPYLARALP